MRTLVCAAVLLALPSAAWADRPKADACAVTISYASKRVYDASVDNYVNAVDKREFVHDKVEQLLHSWNGLIKRPSNASIEAAVRCLQLLAPERRLVRRWRRVKRWGLVERY